MSPSDEALASLMTRTPEAPSVICDELPAVTLPFSGRNAGFRLASVSTEESGRMPSSVVMSSSVSLRSSSFTATGMISRSKRPSAVAWAARWWDSAEKASRSSRLRPHCSAISSAPSPWLTRPPRSA